MDNHYNHKDIESKWQSYWSTEKTYTTLDAQVAKKEDKKPMYVLDMFPYPSGAGLHVGHPRGYIASDVYARMKRMQGYNVLHPMGFDSFGLPAEQYAIKTGNHPGPFTQQLVDHYKEQLSILGFSFDWDRQVATHDPEYFKWTQWIFLQLYNSYYDTTANKARSIADLVEIIASQGIDDITPKAWQSFTDKEKHEILMKYRLAYEGYSEVNWCEELGTVLAHDEVIEKDGVMVSERGEFPVEKKSMRQWFMRISAYADRLLIGLENLDWPENIKEIQRNWIGKSKGAEISFPIKDSDHSIDIFTTRPDTLYGATYLVLAPEHPLVDMYTSQAHNSDEIMAYVDRAKHMSDIDRMKAGNSKTGVLIEGIHALHPLTQEEIPIWIADYVLAGYGTGAIMAVPAHDERDYEFATKFNIPIVRVIKSSNDSELPYDEKGVLINSDEFSGKHSDDIISGITKKAGGKLVTRYKMRDAIFARQRYWGEPIPLIHNNDGTIDEVALKDLPLELPEITSFAHTGNGESPLAQSQEWLDAGYETNTMPGWAGSSWYFLRYTDPGNADGFASREELDYWFGKDGGVDMYVGGAEHATGHLLYARFWHAFLHDRGFVDAPEPFKALRNQGMIGGPDGRKMSKRYGNVINPDDVVDTVGADALRVFEMFLGPFESHLPWSLDGIAGSRRFIEKFWRLQEKVSDASSDRDAYYGVLHKTIKKVHDDIEGFAFNTAISSLMICVNTCEKAQSLAKDDFDALVRIVAPFAPHIAEELWQGVLGNTDSVHLAPWPTYDESALVEKQVILPIQINGKVRAQITVPSDISKDDALQLAQENNDVQHWIGESEIVKMIYVPGKIINIVIKE